MTENKDTITTLMRLSEDLAKVISEYARESGI